MYTYWRYLVPSGAWYHVFKCVIFAAFPMQLVVGDGVGPTNSVQPKLLQVSISSKLCAFIMTDSEPYLPVWGWKFLGNVADMHVML